MKPKVNDKKCGAIENACKVIKICPVEAISYIETDEPVTDRKVDCNAATKCSCNCDCNENSNSRDTITYGRIVIDYDKCTGCGLCSEECCGTAIEMVD